MLLIFAYVGSIASALWILISPSVRFLGPILVIISMSSLGCSFVLLNAFLPLLVANHHEPIAKYTYDYSSHDLELDTLSVPRVTEGTAQPKHNSLSAGLDLSARISSKGVGLGYASAVLVQVFSILVLWLFSKTDMQTRHPTLSIRVILLIVGVWWALFTIPAMLWLKPRPGRPLPTLLQQSRGDRRSTLRSA